MAGQKVLTENQQEQLVKIAPTAYSTSGFPPVASEWKLTYDQVCSIIKKHTKAWLDDVQDVTLEHNRKNGALYAYVWIPNNSSHICDTTLSGGNSAINRTMRKYSAPMKEYMEKFCAKDRRHVFSAEGSVQLSGLEIMLDKIMKIEFDESGYEYGRQFGENNKKKTKVVLTCNYSKEDDGKFGKFLYLQVDKSLKSSFSSITPRPKKSYNAR